MGTGSPPYARRRLVPTRPWKAFLNFLFATLGLPKVTQRTSASGYSIAAHAAPAHQKYYFHGIWMNPQKNIYFLFVHRRGMKQLQCRPSLRL